jgi:hypothetical protein
MTAVDCDACYTCQECGRPICADARPSPGEPFVCDDCSLLTEQLAMAWHERSSRWAS